MKRMVEMICCDICGKPLDTRPDYLESYLFKDNNGDKSKFFLCESCYEDKTAQCDKCSCYLRIEDAFSFDKAGDYENYCWQCVEQAIEDKLQEIEDVKKEIKLVDAKKAFERRKVKRE